jgi:hypothetical protein
MILMIQRAHHGSFGNDSAVAPPNGSHAKLCGQGPRAEADAARRLPRMMFVELSRELQPT